MARFAPVIWNSRQTCTQTHARNHGSKHANMPQAKYWNLLRELTLSQIKLKDSSTFFGFVWSFLNPVLVVAVLYVFFQARLAEGVQNFPIYLLIGVVLYTHFSSSSGIAMHVLHSMRALTGQMVFPKEIMVIGSVLASSLEFVLEMIIIVVIAAVAGIPLSGALVWLPFLMLMQFLFVLWVSFALSCLYVFVRDLEHLYNIFLRLLFFVTPVFYAPAFLGTGIARWALRLNPLAELMALVRGIVLDGTPPPLLLTLILFALNCFALLLAWRFFKLMEPRFAEYV